MSVRVCLIQLFHSEDGVDDNYTLDSEVNRMEYSELRSIDSNKCSWAVETKTEKNKFICMKKIYPEKKTNKLENTLLFRVSSVHFWK